MTGPADNAGQESPHCADGGHAHVPHDGPSEAIASEPTPGLSADLASLTQTGADLYDPVRFHAIAAMCRRAGEQRAPVTAIVEQKAATALQAYQRDFAKARQEAAVIVGQVEAQFPESAERIRQLFDSCDFRALRRLANRLRRSPTGELLAGLTAEITTGEAVQQADNCEPSLDDMLRQQELDALSSTVAKGTQGPANTTGQASVELKAVRYFRESLVKVNADRLIRQAIEDIPEDSGPLNPQMLIIRSLAMMGELSPQYLQRFVAYLDTLLWLEQADASGEPAGAKKTAARRETKDLGNDQQLL